MLCSNFSAAAPSFQTVWLGHRQVRRGGAGSTRREGDISRPATCRDNLRRV